MTAEKGPGIVVKVSHSLPYALKYSYDFYCVSGKAVCLSKSWSALDEWVSDVAVALSLPMRPGTGILSPFRRRAGTRHSSHGSLAPFSLLKADQPGHEALAGREQWGDARPAWIAGSGLWSTSGFPDMLPPLEPQHLLFTTEWSPYQDCRCARLDSPICGMTFCSDQLGSEAVPCIAARQSRAWVSAGLINRVPQI